jgi:hypothetical protein
MSIANSKRTHAAFVAKQKPVFEGS